MAKVEEIALESHSNWIRIKRVHHNSERNMTMQGYV